MPQKLPLAILVLMFALGITAPLELLIISTDSKPSASRGPSPADSAAEPDLPVGAALSATKKSTTRRTRSTSPRKTSKKSPKVNPPAEEPLAPQKVDIRFVKTESELFAAVSDSSVSQITLSSDIVIVANLEISRNLIIDLNNFNLTSLKENTRIIDIKYGEVFITGKGSIVAYGPGGAAVRIKGATTADNANYSHVIIDREVTLFAPNYYGLFVTPNFNAAYGVTVDFYGSMIAQDGICINGNIQGTGENAPVINLLDGADITVDENSGTALYAAGYGVWNISQVTIEAATGIGIKSGVLNLQGSRIRTTGAFDDPTGWNHGLLGVGAVIQIEDHPDYAGNIHIAIDGGEYRSVNSHVFVEYGDLDAAYSLQSFEIKSGDFAGQLGIFCGIAPSDDPSTATAVYGGTFSEDITSYLAPGHHLDLGNHGYLVIDEQELYAQGIEAHLAQTRERLRDLITLSDTYINGKYAKGDLGAWQPRVKTLLTTLKRMYKLAQKADHPKSNLDKLESSIRSLSKAIKNLEGIGDEIRTEIFSTIAAIDSINPPDYTAYSYNQLIDTVDSARLELDRNSSTLEELYSILLDLEINIDLLEEAADDLPTEEYHVSLPSPTPTTPAPEPAPEPAPASSPSTPEETVDDFDSGLVDIFRELGASALLSILNEGTDEALPTAPVDPPIDLSVVNPPQEPGVRLAPSPTSVVMPAPSSLPPMVVTPILQPTVIPTSLVDDTAYIEAKTNLLAALSAVDNLTVSDYNPAAVEQFGELQVAISKARAALVKPFVSPDKVLRIMEEIQTSISGLKSASEPPVQDQTPLPATPNPAEASSAPAVSPDPAPVSIDWAPLREVITDVSSLDSTTYTAQSYSKVLSELQRAKALLTYPATTQEMIEDIVFDINLAILELETLPAVQTINTVPVYSYTNTYVDQSPAESPLVAAANTTEAHPSVVSTTLADPDDDSITPSFLMSMMAGAYAGLATYHRSRLAAKKRRLS